MKARVAAFAFSAMGTIALTSGSASALPNGLLGKKIAPAIEHVRLTCDHNGYCVSRKRSSRHARSYGGPVISFGGGGYSDCHWVYVRVR